MEIQRADKADYAELIQLWEDSVRATHDFLNDEQIANLKPLILAHYFDAVILHCIRDEQGKIMGFSGVADGNLEMLFVASSSRGQGIGRQLCEYVIEKHAVTKVDVNEQNPQALGFYQKIGFKVVGRSPLDGQGNPFPLLHMALDIQPLKSR